MTTGTPPPTARKRSRARTLVPLAVAAWAVLEIWLLILVADTAGGLTVVILLAAGIVLGAAVIKRAGRRAFRNLTETLQRMPGQPGADGSSPAAPESSRGNGFLMLGGLLIMIPGLISDVAGLLLWCRRCVRLSAGTRSARWTGACAPPLPAASRTRSSRPASTAPTARWSRARSSATTRPTTTGARTTSPAPADAVTSHACPHQARPAIEDNP